MKRYTSVAMLYIGSIFKKILLLFTLMGLFEMYLFIRAFQIAFYPDKKSIFTIGSYTVERSSLYTAILWVFENSKIHLVFFLSFLLLTVILSLNGVERKEKISYTLRRLSIPEKQVYFVHGFTHTMVYLLFFSLQIILVFLMGQYYLSQAPNSFYSHQTLLLTFYNDTFLHSILPLEETFKLLRNLLLIVSFGFETAYFSYGLRKGRKPLTLPILTLLTVVWFESELGYHISDWLCVLMYFFVLAQIGYHLLIKEEKRL